MLRGFTLPKFTPAIEGHDDAPQSALLPEPVAPEVAALVALFTGEPAASEIDNALPLVDDGARLLAAAEAVELPSPMAICEGFSLALLNLAALPLRETSYIRLDEQSQDFLEVDLLAVPPICLEVGECLATLPPERARAAAPIIHNIGRARERVHLQRSAETQAAKVAAETRLTTLCEALLTALDLPSSEAAVRELMQSILRAEFVYGRISLSQFDLEHMGTHEVKRRLTQMQGTFQYFLVHSLLGSLPLVRTHILLRATIRSLGSSAT